MRRSANRGLRVGYWLARQRKSRQSFFSACSNRPNAALTASRIRSSSRSSSGLRRWSAGAADSSAASRPVASLSWAAASAKFLAD